MPRKKKKTEEPVVVEKPVVESAPDSPPTEPERIVETIKGRRELRCVLTDAEKEEHNQALVQSLLRTQDLEDRKAAAASQYGSDIKESVATTKRLRDLLNAGHEFRTVPIETTKDWTDGTIVTVRLDTCERIEDRAMVGVELQIPNRFLQKPDAVAEKWVDGEALRSDGAPIKTETETETKKGDDVNTDEEPETDEDEFEDEEDEIEYDESEAEDDDEEPDLN